MCCTWPVQHSRVLLGKLQAGAQSSTPPNLGPLSYEAVLDMIQTMHTCCNTFYLLSFTTVISLRRDEPRVFLVTKPHYSSGLNSVGV